MQKRVQKSGSPSVEGEWMRGRQTDRGEERRGHRSRQTHKAANSPIINFSASSHLPV